MITAQIAKPYHFLQPIVYRYMPQEYIDLFFETGKLRLSSFSSYTKYEDTVKGDKGEGFNIATATSKKENYSLYAVVGVGTNAYSICTSTILDENLKQKFDCDGVFKIKDSQSFGLAVANKILGFIEGMQGLCQYVDIRSTKKTIESLDLDEMRISPDKKELDMGKMLQKVNEANSIDSFFMKPLSYQYQSEYRFIWLVDKKNNDFLDIECPEAIQFCEKVLY